MWVQTAPPLSVCPVTVATVAMGLAPGAAAPWVFVTCPGSMTDKGALGPQPIDPLRVQGCFWKFILCRIPMG